ncbi:MAG: hypothetical protein H5U19_03520 [Rhodobacteraceae bacterium]|jgi:hypothetical protein|nr:hypothetical protein [Paracoccaceae bacterium]
MPHITLALLLAGVIAAAALSVVVAALVAPALPVPAAPIAGLLAIAAALVVRGWR